MKPAIVVENKQECEFLRAILPNETLAQSQFVLSINRNRLGRVATTLAAVDKTPVAVICDSNSLDHDTIAERRMWMESNLSLFASKKAYRVIMAVPEIETILIDAEILTRAFGMEPSESVMVMGRYSPKEALAEMNKLSGKKRSPLQIAEAMNSSELEKVRSHPIIRELIEFLDNVGQSNGVDRPLRNVELADV